MSESIDNRVVQMRFDNDQFERGIQTSIRSLKKLDDSMDFESGTKSFHQLEKTINDTKFDKLLAGLDSIANRFTFIGQLGMRLKNEVIDKLIDSGERMVKSLSMDQVSVGWDKYADKTSAVQTIMSATSKEFTDTAKQMEYVNSQLEQLTWFTDETSYNFLDMVSNIGKFTNMNIKLDEASTSMQGIAVWAAKSGANANEASRAMYNISQSLGTGAMRLQDWMSIENANMATAEFKETAIQTAAALGTLQKGADGVYRTMAGNEVTIQNFREYLSDGWLTAEALTGTLTRYGAAVGELNKLYNDLGGEITTSTLVSYIDEFVAGTLDLDTAAKEMGMTVEEVKERLGVFNTEAMQFSLKAFKAAQEAKTFAEALNSVKDAVSSKWMQSFEFIFGDYEQAKELWTNMANILYDIFAASGDTRNEMLGLWAVMEKGGRDTFIDSLYESLAAILQILKPIQAGFQAVFPPMTAERLAELVQGFNDFLKTLRLTDEQMTKLSRIFRGVFSVADILFTLVKQAGAAGFELLRKVLGLFNVDILETGASFGDLIYNFRNFIKETNIFEAGANKIIELFNEISKVVSDFQKQFFEEHPEVSNVFEQFTDAGWKAYDDFKLILNAIKNTFARFGEGGDLQLPEIKNFEDFKAAIRQVAGVIDEELQKLGIDFSKFGVSIDKFQNGGSGLLSMISNTLSRFGDIFVKVGKAIGQYLPEFNLLNVALIGLGAGTIFAASKIADGITLLANVLRGFSGIGVSITRAIDALRGVFVEYQKNLKADRIRGIALSIGILVAELIVLSLIPTDKLIKAGVAMLGLTVVIVGLCAALNKIGNVEVSAVMLLSLAASLTLLALALNAINPENIAVKIAAMIAMMVTLVAFMTQMNKSSATVKAGAGSVIAMAASLLLMIHGLKKLSELDPKAVASQIPNIIIIVGSLLLLEKLFGNSKVVGKGSGVNIFNSKATSLIAMAASLILIIQAFEALNKLDPSSIAIGIAAMTAVFIGMAGLMAASKLAGQYASKAGIMLLAVSVALNLMVVAIKGLGKLDPNLIANATNSLVAITAMFAIMTGFSKLAGENAHKAGLMFLEAAAAITLLTLAIQVLGKVPDKELAKGVGAVSVLIGMFSLMTALSRSADYAKKTIITVTVVLGLLTAMIVGLSFVDDSKVLSIGLALSALMVAMGVLARGMNDVEVGAKSALALSITVGILGGILALVSQWANPEGIIPIAVGLSVLLLAFSGAIAILGTFAPAAKLAESALPAIIKIGAIVLAVIAVLGAVAAGLGALDKETNGGVLETFQRAIPIMQSIGEAIGSLVGGLAGGLIAGGVEAILSKLPQWGTYLSDFASNLDGFLSMLDSLASDGGGKAQAVVALGSIIGTLGSSTIFKKEMSEEQMENAKTAFKALGDAVVAFSDSVSGLTDDSVDKAEKAAEIGALLAQLQNNLPRTGGVLQDWLGEKDLGLFADRMTKFGDAIVAFSDAVTGDGGEVKINSEAVKAAADAGKLLSDLENSLPTTGGKLQEWLGQKDLGQFSNKMRTFANAIVAVSETLVGEDGGIKVNSEAVKAAADAGMLLSNLQNSLPNTGGTLTNWLFGEKDLATFATNIKELATALVDFATETSGITTDGVQPAIDVLNTISAIDTSNAGTGGFIGWLTGTKGSMETFAAQLKTLGQGLVDFNSKLVGQNWSDTYTAMWALEEIATLADPAPAYKKLTEGVTAMLNDTVALITNSEKDFKIEASLIPKWIALGFQEGVTKWTAQIKTAGKRIGAILEQAVKDRLEINSPSVVMIEIGHYVIKGLAEGIESDMSAEEAAKKKADNIVAAFQSIFDRISTFKSSADLEFQLFEAMNQDATDEEKQTAKRNSLIKSMNLQAEAVATARAAYEAARQQFGEASVQTQEAYNKLLQEQVDFYKLVNELRNVGANTGTDASGEAKSQADKFKEYAKLLSENYEALSKMGFSDEEIQEAFQQQTGWRPKVDVAGTTNEVEAAIQQALDTALVGTEGHAPITIEIAPPDPLKTQQVGQQIGQQINTGIQGTVGTGGQQIGEQYNQEIANGIIDTVDKYIPGAGEKISDGMQRVTDLLNTDLGINSPSKVAYQIGAYYIEGLKLGLIDGVAGLGEIGHMIASAMKGLNTPNVDENAVATVADGMLVSIGLGVQNGSEQVILAVSSVIKTSAQEGLKVTPQFISVGQSMAMQIVVGLQDKFEAIGQAAAQAVQAAFAAAMGAAGALSGGLVGGSTGESGLTPVSTSDWMQTPGSGFNLVGAPGLHGTNQNQNTQIGNILDKVSAFSSSRLGGQQLAQAEPIQQNNYNFTQNNTSPKALNNTEIYRQTKTQFARFKNQTNKRS